ncbi:GtrA family protein, partial [candidate division WWE3 bacterium]|nr:GtrA family protein [candidate division WWE3 bacterium]
GLYRKSLSIGGSYFAKICLWIFAVNDFTSGYKATRVKGYLDKVDLNTIRSKGFAYKIDLLYRIHRLGARIEEVPIKFGLRDRGDSKMERNNMLDSLKVVLSIRLKESANFIKFVVVGFIGLATDLSVFNLLRISMSSANSSYLSGAVAMIVTYLFNNFWSFNDRKISSNTNLVKRFPVYALSSLIPIVARSLLIKSGVARFGDTALVANILFLVGVTFGVIWNFTVYSKFIWKAPNK